MAFPYRTVGFDLDGTLLDTSGDLAAAVNAALAEAGCPPLPVARVRPMIGGGSRHMLAQGLAAAGADASGAVLDRLQPVLLAHYEANIAVHTRPFPGCLDALDRLADLGCRLAVATNKYERLARIVLDALGLTARFDGIVGGDTLGPGTAKPAPDMVRRIVADGGGGPAAFVGDSIYDVRAARAAGVPVVAVSFGFLTGPVEELGADAVIDHYDELVPVLVRLGGQ